MTGSAARQNPRLVSPPRLPFLFRHTSESLQEMAQQNPMHRFSFANSFSLKVYLRANPRLAHLVGNPLFDRHFEDPALLSSVAHELPELFSELMPEMNYDSELCAIMTPFTYVTVLATPAFAARFLDERGAITCSMNLTHEQSLKVRHRVAVLSILRNVYGMNIGYTSRSLQFRQANSDGLVQNWDIHLDPRFYEVSRVKGAPTASERDLHDVLNLLDSPEEALKILQPHHYRFDGLILLRALENTTQHLISDLQHFLIEDERNIIDGDMFSRLCEKLRRLLEHSGLQFALVLPVQGKFLIVSEDRGLPERLRVLRLGRDLRICLRGLHSRAG